jgi:Zn-dependent protease
MIELRLKNIRICFRFSFFAAVTLLMLCSGSRYAVLSFYACLLHECGHLVTIFLCRQPVKKLVFYGAGIKIIRPNNDMLNRFGREMLIVCSGCAVNVIIYAISVALPCSAGFTALGEASLAVGMFNLMPLSFLDGGKILILLFYKFFPYETAVTLEKALKWVNIVTVPAAAVILFIVGLRNFTIYVTLMFLLFTSVMM